MGSFPLIVSCPVGPTYSQSGPTGTGYRQATLLRETCKARYPAPRLRIRCLLAFSNLRPFKTATHTPPPVSPLLLSVSVRHRARSLARSLASIHPSLGLGFPNSFSSLCISLADRRRRFGLLESFFAALARQPFSSVSLVLLSIYFFSLISRLTMFSLFL